MSEHLRETLNKDVFKRVVFLAKKENRSFTNMVETLLLQSLDDYEKYWILKEANKK